MGPMFALVLAAAAGGGDPCRPLVPDRQAVSHTSPWDEAYLGYNQETGWFWADHPASPFVRGLGLSFFNPDVCWDVAALHNPSSALAISCWLAEPTAVVALSRSVRPLPILGPGFTR